MPPTSARQAMIGLLAVATSSTSLAMALPARDGPSVFRSGLVAESFQKRAIMKGDEYVPLGNTTIPLTPVLLVICGLAAAVIGLAIGLVRQFVPSLMSRQSRIILEERERAKQDLRIRGASPRTSPKGSPKGSLASSPTPGSSTPHERRYPPNKLPRRLGSNLASGSATPSEILSHSEKRPGHGYRGTSFSLSQGRKNTDMSHQSSVMALNVPLLNSNDSSSGSSNFHVNERDVGTVERARYPITATNDLIGRAYGSPSSPTSQNRPSFGTRFHLNRTSSIGKGADLQRSRSGKRESEISLHPQLIDRAYSARPHPLHHTGMQGRRDSHLYEVSSSSGGHSYLEGSSVASRMGSFSMATGKPLQPSSTTSFGPGQYYPSQPWASPQSTSRSNSPDFLTAAPSAAMTAGRSNVTRHYDSDEASDPTTPNTQLLIPSRVSSSGSPPHPTCLLPGHGTSPIPSRTSSTYHGQ